MPGYNGGQPLSVFQVAGRAMQAQLVRMNTTASNLANAGVTATTEAAAYRTMKPVFRTSFDQASGMATVDVERVVTAGEAPTKRYDPSNPMADKDGNVFDAAVDETRELVDMMESQQNQLGGTRRIGPRLESMMKKADLENIQAERIWYSSENLGSENMKKMVLPVIEFYATREGSPASLDLLAKAKAYFEQSDSWVGICFWHARGQKEI